MTAAKTKDSDVALTTVDLFNNKQESLDLHWWSGNKNSGLGFTRLSFSSSEIGLVGYFNLIHPNQAQILGETELNFFNKADENILQNLLTQLFKRKSAAIFISDGLAPPEGFREQSLKYDLPIICSSLSSNELIDQLRYYLTQALAEKEILHGVFMEVISVGVLITGQSGLGKSELALDLVSRGHRLIADDAPEFARIAPETVNGTCPKLLQNFLEVRGLGVLNIREMYGDSAIKSNKFLRLIIELIPPKMDVPKTEDRLRLSERKNNILGVDIPTISLPVAPGRNLAVLVSGAINTLEDDDFYCIDNMPLSMLLTCIEHLTSSASMYYEKIAIGVDARNASKDIVSFPDIIKAIKKSGIDLELIHLEAKEETLIQRYSETRRKHPLTKKGLPLVEAIQMEKHILEDLVLLADLRIDTSSTNVRELRSIVTEQVCRKDSSELTILLQSFGFKYGVPNDSDYVFDVRCLPNPYWEKSLRELSGKDPEVIEYLQSHEEVKQMIESISSFMEKWVPLFAKENRSYLSVSIGCTGGHHRSVHVTEYLSDQLSKFKDTHVSLRHRDLEI